MNINTLMPWSRKTASSRAYDEHPLVAVQREMDRMFDDLWRRVDVPLGDGNGLAWSPRTDVAETPEGIELTMELPGLEEKDVELMIEGDNLIVRGEKRQEIKEEDKEKNWLVSERRWGRFQRVLPLPSTVDREKIDATFSKGLLKVTLPKTEEARRESRRIDIKAA